MSDFVNRLQIYGGFLSLASFRRLFFAFYSFFFPFCRVNLAFFKK